MTVKRSLAKKAFRGFLVFAVVLILSICITIAMGQRVVTIKSIYHATQGCALTISDTIDGDSIRKYAETKECDAYYYEIRDYLRSVKENFQLMYCYVYVPDGTDFYYVWNADDEGENMIGTHVSYSSKRKELTDKAFSKTPVYDFMTDSSDDYGSFMVTAAPIYDSAGEPVALVGIEVSTKDVRMLIFKMIVRAAAIIILITSVFSIAYYKNMRKKLIQPLLDLKDATKDMIDGIINQEKILINVHTDDEIDMLARSFEKMERNLIKYVSENTRITAEKERISAELDMAKQIQAGQLPNVFPAFPDRPEFDIYASMTPAKEVGGDFYDFFFIDDNHLAMVMADVSGKGVPAALFMMMSKILINNYAMMGLSPHEVLERTNETICQNNKQKMFVTVWFGILEISTGKVTAANAGHEYPIIRNSDGKFELFKDKHGFVIGGIKGKKYKEYEFIMQKGSTLFVYTDGIPEATNADEELFGTNRLIEIMNQTPDAMPQQLLTNIHEAVNDFVGDAPQFDDLTMLGITLL